MLFWKQASIKNFPENQASPLWPFKSRIRDDLKTVIIHYIFKDTKTVLNRCQSLNNFGQKYLAFIKISPNMAAKLYEPLMEFSEQPIDGVKLEEAYQVFGKWDFAVLFQADTNTNALHFVGDKIRLVEGVIETLTIPLAPIKDYRK